jgi:hypothetical protein
MRLIFNVDDNPHWKSPMKGVPNKNSRRYKKIFADKYDETIYLWVVRSFKNEPPDYPVMHFRLWGSERKVPEKLGEITYDAMLAALNSQDFEGLEPIDGDLLEVYQDYLIKDKENSKRALTTQGFFEFVYLRGQWSKREETKGVFTQRCKGTLEIR